MEIEVNKYIPRPFLINLVIDICKFHLYQKFAKFCNVHTAIQFIFFKLWEKNKYVFDKLLQNVIDVSIYRKGVGRFGWYSDDIFFNRILNKYINYVCALLFYNT